MLKHNSKNLSFLKTKCLSNLWIQPNYDNICLEFKILSGLHYSLTETKEIIRGLVT
jgi:hypothetical protein